MRRGRPRRATGSQCLFEREGAVTANLFSMTHHVECVAILEPAEKGR